MSARGLATLGVALLAGCCGGPDYALLAYNPRVELETRDGFAVIATVGSDSRAWAYGEPAALLAPHTDAYRPGTAVGESILPTEDAPPQVASVLAALRRACKELGYRPASGDSAGFVISVALSWYDDGSLARAAVNVGSELDGVFDPHIISLAATLPEADACPVSAAEIVETLVSVLPPRETEPEEEP